MTFSSRPLVLQDFAFDLPPELIAQHPAVERTGSRLLDGSGSVAADRMFRDLPGLLRAGDLLVFNDTQVIKARLFGRKPSGGQVELLVERVLHEAETANTVAAHMKASRKPVAGAVLHMDGGFTATVLGRWPDARGALFRLQFSADPYALMAQHGHVPLPPYITHADDADDERRLVGPVEDVDGGAGHIATGLVDEGAAHAADERCRRDDEYELPVESDVRDVPGEACERLERDHEERCPDGLTHREAAE